VVLGGRAALETQAAGLAAGGDGVQAAGARGDAVPRIQLLQQDLSTRTPGPHTPSISILKEKNCKS